VAFSSWDFFLAVATLTLLVVLSGNAAVRPSDFATATTALTGKPSDRSGSIPAIQAIRQPAAKGDLLAARTYIDRGTLATAAPLMQDELHLSARQLGRYRWT
jgi:hypothetical protein